MITGISSDAMNFLPEDIPTGTLGPHDQPVPGYIKKPAGYSFDQMGMPPQSVPANRRPLTSPLLTEPIVYTSGTVPKGVEDADTSISTPAPKSRPPQGGHDPSHPDAYASGTGRIVIKSQKRPSRGKGPSANNPSGSAQPVGNPSGSTQPVDNASGSTHTQPAASDDPSGMHGHR